MRTIPSGSKKSPVSPRRIECDLADVVPFDLLAAAPSRALLAEFDAVLVGGSGNYSAAGEGVWLDRALAGLRQIVDLNMPMFASCWGFQALARALGGRCEHAPQFAELGTIELATTAAGRDDPLFATLPPTFLGQAGHEDCVTRLPEVAVWLASSERTAYQAFRVAVHRFTARNFTPNSHSSRSSTEWPPTHSTSSASLVCHSTSFARGATKRLKQTLSCGGLRTWSSPRGEAPSRGWPSQVDPA